MFKYILTIPIILLVLFFFPTEYPEKNIERVKIAFVGDIMLDRNMREIGEKNGYQYIFENFKHPYDLVIANLEGPVTVYKSKSVGSKVGETRNTTFTFSQETTQTLFDNKIKIVNIGNNHILDFGKEGLEQTKHFLTGNKILSFGNHYKRDYLLFNIANLNISFISFNQFLKPDIEETIESIKKTKKISDFVVVYTHWGDEYKKKSNLFQQNTAHRFIDVGADLIIGSHPHVIQEKEIYKEKYIYYSLGNFIFDQYWENNVRCGMVVSFEIENGKISEPKEYFSEIDRTGQIRFSNCFNTELE
jgi:poly-gamma-glutamate synthesis protein (capsule biosynthesis protein)